MAGDALEDHLASSPAFREYRKSFAAIYGEEREWGAQERKSIAAKRESVHVPADWSESEEEEEQGGVESGASSAIPQNSEETPEAGHEAGGPSDGGPSEEVLAPAPSAASSPKGRGGIFSMLRRKQTEPIEEPAPTAPEVTEEAYEETPAQKSRRERLERLAKLEEAQRLATEAQRQAAEELRMREAEEQQVAEEAAAVSAGGGRRRRSTWFGSRKASTSSATSTSSPCRTETSQEPAEPPPRWYTLLVTYREQKAEIEGWLETEPTEEEMADGSALQKAFTLMTARDELQAKIEQLEAIAAQEGGLIDDGSGGPPRLAGRVRRGSSVTGVI